MKAIVVLFTLIIFPLLSLASPTIQDYGRLPEISRIVVSPSGERIAYLNSTDGQDFVVIHSLKEGKRLQVINTSGIKARDLYFLDENSVFLRAGDHRRVSGFKGRFEVSTGFSLSVSDGGVKQLLTPGDKVVYPGQSGLGDVVGMSQDGKYAYMPAYYGEPTRILGEWAPPNYALLKVRINATGKPRKHTLGKEETFDFFIGPKDNILARVDYDESNNKLAVFAKHKKKWVEVFTETTAYRTKAFVGLTPDYEHLVILDTSDKTGREALFKLALVDGKVTGPFYDHPDRDISHVLTDIQRVVHGIAYSGMTPTYTFLDSDLQKRVDAIIGKFPEHSVIISDYSPDWKHIVMRVEGSQAPGDFYLFSEGKKPVFLASMREKIQPKDMNPLGTVTVTVRDGLKIPTIITIPKNSVTNMKNLPAVMLPHGGPYANDSLRFDYEAQALAQQGYLVIQPQYRGSEGFGQEHAVAGFGEWGGKMQDDLTDTLKFFVGNGMVDPDRVCIVGSSYGGYAALAGGAFTPDLYRCVVAINGIGNLKDFLAWVREERGRSSGVLAYWKMQIGGKEYTPEESISRSPELNAEHFKAPTLLIYSSDDENVPPIQSKRMAKVLHKKGRSVETVELEGDDHYMSESATRLKALQATIEFVNKHLKK